MDKTFMFFQSLKHKKGSRKVYNNSRSNSSKRQPIKSTTKIKQQPKLTLTKKQRQIRQAIAYRFAKSKMRDYHYQFQTNKTIESDKYSNSGSEMQQYRYLKDMKVVVLKQFHQRQPLIKSQSKDKKNNFTRLKFPISKNNMFKTETSINSKQKESKQKSYKKNFDRNKSELTRKKQQWKFISIQLKAQDRSKQKKTQLRINSHRTLNIQSNPKQKTRSVQKSWGKSTQKIPKLKNQQFLHQKYKF